MCGLVNQKINDRRLRNPTPKSMSLGSHFGFWAAYGPRWTLKNAKIMSSLPNTINMINYKKNHVRKNYAKNFKKFNKGVYYETQWVNKLI